MSAWLLRGVRRYPGDSGERHDLRIDDGVISSWSDAGRGDATAATVIDLDGSWILPAFADSHLHLLYSIEHSRQHDLAGLSLEEIDGLLADASDGTDSISFVGHGWKDPLPGQMQPDPRRHLDGSSRDVPVFLWNADHHRALVSSAALRCAGIDPSGHPGIVVEEAAERVWSSLPRSARSDAAGAASWLLNQGITAATTFDRGDSIDILRQENSAGQLGIRIRHGMPEELFLERTDSAGDCIPEGEPSSPFAVRWIKIFIDGTLGSRTAWMKSAYCDDPGNLGISRRSGELLDNTARLAADRGWALAIHAIGDAAVCEANRVIALIRSLRREALPDRIEHFQCFDPSDLDSIRATGSIASMQPCHLYQDRQILTQRWGERAAHALALRTIDEAGIPLILGSDAPIESADPWRDIDAAVRRLPPDGQGDSFHPHECVSFDSAFRWKTAAAASANWLPAGWGTLAVGAEADLQLIGADDPRQVRDQEQAKLIDVFSLGRWRLGEMGADEG